jgi:hypothetical protein
MEHARTRARSEHEAPAAGGTGGPGAKAGPPGRPRRVGRRFAIWAFLVVVAASLAAVGCLWWRLTLEPSPAVDYCVQLNAAARAVPEEQRAWPLYRQALLEMELLPGWEDSARLPRPGEERWEEVAAYLDRQQDVLALVREAARRDGLGFIVGYELPPEDAELFPYHNESMEPMALGEGALIEVLLPHLTKFRDLGELLMLDTHRVAAAGDGERAIEDLRAMVGMACQLREQCILIVDIVAQRIVSSAAETAGDVLAHHPDALSDIQLQSLRKIFDEPDDAFACRLISERWHFYDIVQRIYSDDGEGDGRVTLKGVRLVDHLCGRSREDATLADTLLDIVRMFSALSRCELVETYDQLMDIAEEEQGRPLWEWKGDSAVETELVRLESGGRLEWRYPSLWVMLPATDVAARRTQLWLARRDALLVAIALEMHRRRRGAWPEALDELVPELLGTIPPDRFDGRPLRYAVIEGEPLLYSIGTDRDDDGGRAAVSEETGRAEYDAAAEWIAPGEVKRRQALGEVPDGDWILWPAPVEPIYRSEP